MNQGRDIYMSEATQIKSHTAYVDSSQENIMTLPSLSGIFKVQTIMTLTKRECLGNSLKILLGSFLLFFLLWVFPGASQKTHFW